MPALIWVVVGIICARNLILCYTISDLTNAVTFSFEQEDIILTYYNISVKSICNCAKLYMYLDTYIYTQADHKLCHPL